MKVAFMDIAPIQEIYEECLVNGNGDLTAGFGLLLPEVFTNSDKEYQNLHHAMVKVIKRLPLNAIIHFQGYYYVDQHRTNPEQEGNLIQQENLKYYQSRDVLKNHNYLFLTVRNKNLGAINATNNSFIRLGKYLFNKPFKEVQKTFDTFQNAIDSFSSNMNAIDSIRTKRLNKEQMKNALYDYFSLSYHNPRELVKGKVNPPIEISDGYLRVGDQYVAVISLIGEGEVLNSSQVNKTLSKGMTGVRMPNEIGLPTSMTFPIGLGLPFDHILNVSIEILDNEEVIRKLKASKTGLFLLKTFGSNEAAAKIKEIGDNLSLGPGFIDAVAEGGFQICATRVNMIINDSNLKRLQEKITISKNAYAQMNDSIVHAENAETGNLFFASAPGNIRHNYKSFIQTVDQSVCYLPKETQYRSDSSGILWVDRFGKPIVLDMWKNPYIVNRNKVIFGPSGSGKSVLVNNLISQSLAAGNIVICIDIGGSYKRNCELNSGYYFDAGDSKNLSFNIFLCDQDAQGKYLYKQIDSDGEGEDDTINFVYSIIMRIWKGEDTKSIRNEEKTVVKRIIESFYEFINEQQLFPDMREFQKFLTYYKLEKMSEVERKYMEIEGLTLVLEPFVNGQYRDLLNNRAKFRMRDNQYTVFDLEAIKNNEDIRTIVIAIILFDASYIIDRIKGKRKSLIIDEAIDFLTGDMGEFIAGQYRKIRKRNGEVYLATQGIGYLDVLDELTRRSIFGNSDTKILLNHKNDRDSYPLLRKYLSMTDFDIELLDSIDESNHEFFIKMGQHSRIFRGDYSPFALGVYTSDPKDNEIIEAHLNKSNSLKTAIYQYIQEKQSLITQETKNLYEA